MVQEFKQHQDVYGRDGREYRYHQASVGGGHFVYTLLDIEVDCDQYGPDITTHETEPFFINDVYPLPPITKIAAEFVQAEESLKLQEGKLRHTESKINEAENQLKEIESLVDEKTQELEQLCEGQLFMVKAVLQGEIKGGFYFYHGHPEPLTEIEGPPVMEVGYQSLKFKFDGRYATPYRDSDERRAVLESMLACEYKSIMECSGSNLYKRAALGSLYQNYKEFEVEAPEDVQREGLLMEQASRLAASEKLKAKRAEIERELAALEGGAE